MYTNNFIIFSGPEHVRLLQSATQSPKDFRLDDLNKLQEMMDNEPTSNEETDGWSTD